MYESRLAHLGELVHFARPHQYTYRAACMREIGSLPDGTEIETVPLHGSEK